MSQLTSDLNWRYATKYFDPEKKLEDSQVQELCEALRLSASSFGLQFWKFVLISCPEFKKELRAHSWNQAQIAECSHLFVLCSPLTVGDSHVEHYLDCHCQIRGMEKEQLQGYGKIMKDFINGMDQQQCWNWMDKQIYLALGNLLTSCAVKRIDACPIEGFSSSNYDQVLGLKEKGLRSVVVCAVGFRLDTDKYATMPKVRYPMDEVLLEYR